MMPTQAAQNREASTETLTLDSKNVSWKLTEVSGAQNAIGPQVTAADWSYVQSRMKLLFYFSCMWVPAS